MPATAGRILAAIGAGTLTRFKPARKSSALRGPVNDAVCQHATGRAYLDAHSDGTSFRSPTTLVTGLHRYHQNQMEQGRRNTKSQMMRSNGISHSSKR